MSTSSASSDPPPAAAAGNWRRPSCLEWSSSSVLATVLVIATVVCSVLLIALTRDSSSSFLSWFFTSSPSSSWSWGDAGRENSPELHDQLRQQQQQQQQQLEEEAVRSPPSQWAPDVARQSTSNPPAPSPAGAPGPASLAAPNNFGELSETRDVVATSGRDKVVDTSLEKLELELAKARASIKLASRSKKSKSPIADEFVPQGSVYLNAYAFHRSYLEMEKIFKIYVYEEGEPPLFHSGPCKSLYSMDGRFIFNMEMEERLRTRDPEKAHVHFLPFSIATMTHYLWNTRSNVHPFKPVMIAVMDYVNTIARKYRYWNRSQGADHVMLSCHDWGPDASKVIPYLHHNSIHVFCNANTSEGFKPSKDASLPEINLRSVTTNGVTGGPRPSKRTILAFFAGALHGHIRPILLEQWKGKDKDVQVYEYLPKGASYYDKMRKSKYCLCPSGSEVASPRIVEAIYLECVPVTISKSYVLPFSDVLNWESFSVNINVEDIPNIKKILMAIPHGQYLKMQRNVKMVQRHFLVNTPPKRFDVYHMILHSIWLRRLNIRIHPMD